MDLTRITITITPDEREALRRLAKSERRDTRNQASIIIREALERMGFLQVDKQLGEREAAHDRSNS